MDYYNLYKEGHDSLNFRWGTCILMKDNSDNSWVKEECIGYVLVGLHSIPYLLLDGLLGSKLSIINIADKLSIHLQASVRITA